MQFSTLYGRLLDQELGSDDSTVLFTTGRRKSGVNDGIQEFADLTQCFVRVSSVTVESTQAEYDLNSTAVIADGDYVDLVSDQPVEFHYTDASSYTTYLSGDDLPRKTVGWLNRYEIGWKDSTGSSGQQLPTCHYLRADGSALLLGFSPAPSSGSSASMKALVPYIARPAALTSDTQEPFTANSSVRIDLRPYHKAAVHYAAHQLEKLRRDDAASDRQLQKFMAYVTRFLQNTRRKGGGTINAARQYFATRGSDRGTDPRR